MPPQPPHDPAPADAAQQQEQRPQPRPQPQPAGAARPPSLQTGARAGGLQAVAARALEWATSPQRNWGRAAVAAAAAQFVLVGLLEVSLMSAVLRFSAAAFGSSAVGFSPFVALYQGLFAVALFFLLIGAVDSYLLRNSLQLIAMAGFQLLTALYSIVQIFELLSFKKCALDYKDIGLDTSLSPQAQLAAAWNLEQSGWQVARHLPIGALPYPTFRTVKRLDNSTFVRIAGTPEPSVIARSIGTNMQLIWSSLSLSYAVVFFMLVFTAACLVVFRKAFDMYGWSIFHAHGADISKRETMRRYHLFIVLLKLNVYFAVGIVVQMLSAIYFARVIDDSLDATSAISGPSASATSRMGSAGITNSSPVDNNLQISRALSATAGTVVFVVSIVYYSLGYYSIKRGSRLLMAAFFVAMALNLVVVLYALFEAIFNDLYYVVRVWLATFAIVQFVLNIATIVSAALCLRDFKNGLPELARAVDTVDIHGNKSIESGLGTASTNGQATETGSQRGDGSGSGPSGRPSAAGRKRPSAPSSRSSSPSRARSGAGAGAAALPDDVDEPGYGVGSSSGAGPSRPVGSYSTVDKASGGAASISSTTHMLLASPSHSSGRLAAAFLSGAGAANDESSFSTAVDDLVARQSGASSNASGSVSASPAPGAKSRMALD
ncbi:hypothetical protein HK105_203082 [Polyrhizophydium stewartii]|uniref:TRP C-terminal domain-containing protein n=1 Tax=Polyrhizophydium stewartii TaxID=2732419 RepID=A0ABR4ND16_9FUNG